MNIRNLRRLGLGLLLLAFGVVGMTVTIAATYGHGAGAARCDSDQKGRSESDRPASVLLPSGRPRMCAGGSRAYPLGNEWSPS